MRYTYFVSYQFNGGFGNVEIFLDAPITAIQHVREIEKVVSQQNGIRICVLNYVLLNAEEKP